MSPELIAILTIGVALGGGQLATVRWAAGRFERMSSETADRFERASNDTSGRFERASNDTAGRFERVSSDMADLRERMARVEGLLEGLRDAVGSRRESA